jgi:hypothetical protein
MQGESINKEDRTGSSKLDSHQHMSLFLVGKGKGDK